MLWPNIPLRIIRFPYMLRFDGTNRCDVRWYPLIDYAPRYTNGISLPHLQLEICTMLFMESKILYFHNGPQTTLITKFIVSLYRLKCRNLAALIIGLWEDYPLGFGFGCGTIDRYWVIVPLSFAFTNLFMRDGPSLSPFRLFYLWLEPH